MPAPKGNKNAEKWTLEESNKFFDKVLDYVLKHDDCCSMSEACSELGWYEELFVYIQNKHKTVDFKPIKKATELIKQRLIKKGLNSEYNPTMSIFILKANHGMNEHQPPKEKNTNITFDFGNTSMTIDDIEKKEDDQS